MQQLVKRYHEVDPEEHRLLKESLASANAKVTECMTTIESLKSTLEEEDKKSKSALELKVEEVKRLRNTYEALEKNTNILRNKLRDVKPKYDDIAAKLAAKTKSEVDLTRQVASMSDEISALS